MAQVALLLLLAQYPPERPPLTPVVPVLWMIFPAPDVDIPPAPPGQPVKLMWLFPKNTASSQSDATAKCAAQAAKTNLTYSHDPANLTRIQVVACLYVPAYTSVGLDQDLAALFSGVFATQVQAWRDQFHADLVQMASIEGCGLGYQDAWKHGKQYGLSAVKWSCATGNFSSEHEMGHNEGIRHDAPNQSLSPYFPDAEGFCDKTHARRDPMVYPQPCGGSRVPYFGNPDISPFGYPFGTATQNAARVLRQTMPIIANFYPPVRLPSPITKLSAFQ